MARKALATASRVLWLGFILATGFNFKTVHADPGMWPFDMLPLDDIQKNYGFRPSADLVDLMKYSMARISAGGSGSFVSPNGLLITNHHVAQPGLQQISTKDLNYEKTGFMAKSQAEEIRVPSYEVNAFVGLEDVTTRVLAAVKPEMTAYQAKKARDRVIAEIEETYFEQTGAKPQVISLFRGSVYHLYKFKRYRDVRLVWAPEKQAGFFGDDEANFHYPRYNLDVALFRVYDDEGKPINTPYFLPLSPFGSTEGELIFVVGNPGTTKRHFSSSELAFERDTFVPLYIEVLEDRERAMIEYRKKGAEPARLSTSDLFSIQNSLKVYRGMQTNLTDNRLVEKKNTWEADIRNRLKGSENDHEWAEALKEIENAQRAYEQLFPKLLAAGSLGVNSLYYQHAMDIVMIAEQTPLHPLEREPRYRASNRPSLELALKSTRPIYPHFEQVKLTQSLGWLVRRFGAEDPTVKEILNGKSPEDRAQELSNSILKSPDVRFASFVGVELGALKLSDVQDPMIPLAQSVRKAQKALEEQIENEVNGPISKAFAKLLRMRRSLGESVYPDATFSPRVAYGVVKTYTDHGQKLPAYTTMGGAFDQAKERDNEGFWELPSSWWSALDAGKVDRTTPLNFVAQLDTIGGNSGSPSINKYGHWIGILFDGNRFSAGQVTHSEPNAKVARSILVDSRAVLSALEGIYGAGYFLDEIRSAWKSKQVQAPAVR